MSRAFTPADWRLVAAVHLLASLGLLAWLAMLQQPSELPDAGGQRIRCVSYSPFYRPGLSPLDAAAHVTPDEVGSDLAALATMTGCVRTYAVNQGLDAVPAAARALGMEVLLGAWIGRDPEANAREVARAIELANAYPGTVRGVVVGNEVLLRGEQDAQALARWLDRVRAGVHVPVTYADVWEFWLRHSELAASVDFVTIHILPFWEDQPVGVAQAVDHVADIRRQVAARFGKPILIGETGWPSEGRQRQGAAPGRVAEARFVRELLLRANREGWDYNLIEAFDQPWKRRLEGTVGGHWGILDVAGQAKFPLDGPVSERSGWGLPPLTALLGASLLALVAVARRRPAAQCLAWSLVGLWAGLAAGMAVEHGQVAWRDSREVLVLGGVLCLGPLWLLLAAADVPSRWREGVRQAILFCAATGALWLAVDPRYRDFPWWLFAGVAPALALVRPEPDRQVLGLLAIILVIAGAARLIPEPGNPEALAWLLLCLLLAAGGWPPREQQEREKGRDGGGLHVV